MEIEVSDEGDILIFANDYATYVISGRRAGAKPPPIAPLISWMKRKGISSPDISINRLAFLIAQSFRTPIQFPEAGASHGQKHKDNR